MLEARLSEAAILKRLLDAIKELVADANFECNEEGIELQAMDNSHVALVSVKLRADGFKRYRCDRPMPLGVNLTSLTKVLKCAKDDDAVTLKAADDADVLGLTYEARNTDRIAEYALKLMDIDSDTLGIPDTDYDARVTMPSSEFARIVRDLSTLGESVRIEVTKEGIRFVSEGEAANGNVLLKHNESVGPEKKGSSSKAKAKGKVKKEEEDEEDEKEDEEDEEGSPKKGRKKVKKEAGDGDVEMEDDEDGEEEQENDKDEDGGNKKRKKAPSKANGVAKKRKNRKGDDDDDETAEYDDADEDADLPADGAVRIELNAAVNLTFSLKYLVNFAKSASLSTVVQLMMSNDVPLLVSFEFGQGYIRYYLAPKIGDD